MNNRRRHWVVAMAAGAALLLAAWRLSATEALPAQCVDVRRLPRIRPDYSQTVVPPNIAPLNFLVEEPGTEFRVRLHGAGGGDVLLASHTPSVVIPLRRWRKLLAEHRGGSIEVDIYVKGADGRWSRYDAITNTVARDEIDSHLVYRLLGPVCNIFHEVRICQRNLENYDESLIVGSDALGGACVNCHSFQHNRPDLFSFEVRPGIDQKTPATGMILVRDGRATRLETRSDAAPRAPGHLSWQQNGWVAFSMTWPDQVFRGAGAEIRDVFDHYSALAALNTTTGATSTSLGIANPDRLVTFPCWSADGKALYFSSARKLWGPDGLITGDKIKDTMYDLMRVSFDVDTGAWGQPETLLAAAETGKSLLEPRASPDGRYLLFCSTDYGGFPLYQPGCHLYLMDLKTGQYRRLAYNGDQTDAWHCWSSNSRWIVFSSKRDNGLLARPYFSYLDAEGRERKPFVLPQKDPAFYDTCLKTYNMPELVTGPVTIPQKELVRAILSGKAAAQPPPQPDSGHYMHE
jgi:hypothetical protein